MQYRKFGRHDLSVSALGFGMMRLPVTGGDSSRIDVGKTKEMVHYAVDRGLNYLDTAFGYHREQSEIVVGEVLKGGYRERVNIATKCPSWLIESHGDYDKYLDLQLRKLQTERIDMYLLHSLDKHRWKKLVETGVFRFLDRAKSDGKIRFVGFSFHDDISTFKTIVDAFDWDHCQIQYNYMDEEFQAGTEGLMYASKKGLAVIVMEPLRGGTLVNDDHPEIGKVWGNAKTVRSAADWGLRWVWNHPEVSLALSGMGTLAQVKENLKTADTSFPNSLTQEELGLYERVKEIYARKMRVDCTGCEYCLPCPQGIVIPKWFEAYNKASMFESIASLVRGMDNMKSEFGDPGSCVQCGQCEDACPQGLAIRQHLLDLLKDLGGQA